MTAAERYAATLRSAGRPMVLKRRVGTAAVFTECTVHGKARTYQPHELVGGIVQGDRRIRIAQADIEAAGWPGPLKKNDILDNSTLQGAEQLYDGSELVGFVCWVRG